MLSFNGVLSGTYFQKQLFVGLLSKIFENSQETIYNKSALKVAFNLLIANNTFSNLRATASIFLKFAAKAWKIDFLNRCCAETLGI